VGEWTEGQMDGWMDGLHLGSGPCDPDAPRP